MPEAIQSVEEVPPLRDPVLITGFLVQRRGGRFGPNLLNHLAGEWHARLVAKIIVEDFYDFSVLRPVVRSVDNKSIIDWPEIGIFLANKEGAKRDLLLIIGSEPHLRWLSFTKAVSAYLRALGVHLIVNLRSFPAPVPHTRPVPIFPASSEPNVASQFGPAREGFKFDGLTDIAEVLSAEARDWGCSTVELSVLQPYYIRPMPRGPASIAVIKALDQAFGGETPLGTLQELALQEQEAIDQGFAGNEEMRAVISALEDRFDSGNAWLSAPATAGNSPSELPSAETVVGEIERLLRERRNPGAPED